MIEQLSDGLWVPSTDAQIEQWREKGYPHMQDKCLKQFVKWCEKNNKNSALFLILERGAALGVWQCKNMPTKYIAMNQTKYISNA